ncbi:MAG TPA: hypothetical protein VN749_06065 [Candidatus Eisenbacteria bacterium]|nr:hypothetical protein [Candidatus Eisenbacteria bacterium]
MLRSLPTLDLALWAATTLVALFLISLIFVRRLDREFPFLTAYIGVNLLQTLAQVIVYQVYGFDSEVTYAAVWGSQAVVILSRALATCEFCYRALGRYVGVWALATRIVLFCGAVVLGLAIYFGKDGFRYSVMTLEIASEAFIATLVVGTFLFAKYYQAPLLPSGVLLGLGLGINSCLKILNDAVLSRYWASYAAMWNEVGMVAFGGVLLLWIFAMRATVAAAVPEAELQPVDVYRFLAPQMNQRLAELNQQLIHLLKSERPKS